MVEEIIKEIINSIHDLLDFTKEDRKNIKELRRDVESLESRIAELESIVYRDE